MAEPRRLLKTRTRPKKAMLPEVVVPKASKVVISEVDLPKLRQLSDTAASDAISVLKAMSNLDTS